MADHYTLFSERKLGIGSDNPKPSRQPRENMSNGFKDLIHYYGKRLDDSHLRCNTSLRKEVYLNTTWSFTRSNNPKNVLKRMNGFIIFRYLLHKVFVSYLSLRLCSTFSLDHSNNETTLDAYCTMKFIEIFDGYCGMHNIINTITVTQAKNVFLYMVYDNKKKDGLISTLISYFRSNRNDILQGNELMHNRLTVNSNYIHKSKPIGTKAIPKVDEGWWFGDL